MERSDEKKLGTASGGDGARDDVGVVGSKQSAGFHNGVASSLDVVGSGGGTAANDEQVIVLGASTSTTHVAANMPLFRPDTMYSVNLDQSFFDEIARTDGKGFLDLVTAGASTKGDHFICPSSVLDGKAQQSLNFEIHTDRYARSSTSLSIQASNNGMLNLARLASAYVSAVKGGALLSHPQKLALLCEVTMGTNPRAEGSESRKELVLTTIPPSFHATANGTADMLLTAMLGAYGFGGDVDPTELSQPALATAQPLGSSQGMADMAEKFISTQWKDRPNERTFVHQPLTGISAGIMATVGQRAPAAAPGFATRDVRKSAFGNTQPYTQAENRHRTIDPSLRARVIADAKAIVATIRNGIVASLQVGLADEVPKAFAAYIPMMVERWAAAIDDGFANVNWGTWYDFHFSVNNWSPAAPVKSTLISAQHGNKEGTVENPLRLHQGDAPDKYSSGG